MQHWLGKKVCVLGLGRSGKAAINLLLDKKARVIAIDDSQDCLSEEEIKSFEERGVTILLGLSRPFPAGRLDLSVVSPGIAHNHPFVEGLIARRIPVWSELELGWREMLCPSIAVSGTNGKTTVTSWIEKILLDNGRRTMTAGNIGTPLCEVVAQSSGLNFMALEVSSFQLEQVEDFRPEVALLLNVAEDHLDRHFSMDNYLRIKARLFENQRSDDYAIIQWEARQRLKQIEVSVAANTLTFSESEKTADLYLDENLIKSRLPGWPSTVLDLNRCNLKGSHNAANLMATLLAGRVLKLPFEEMIATATELQSGAHRCEFVAEWNGVEFYNDSKATNIHALSSALRSMPSNKGEKRNIWLIAGGQNKAMDFGCVTQELSLRVKGAYLIGQTAREMRSVWRSFVTCNLADNMIEAVSEAGRNAVPGDVVLLSPACASFDMFDSYQHRGDLFRTAVRQWMNTISGD